VQCVCSVCVQCNRCSEQQCVCSVYAYWTRTHTHTHSTALMRCNHIYDSTGFRTTTACTRLALTYVITYTAANNNAQQLLLYYLLLLLLLLHTFLSVSIVQSTDSTICHYTFSCCSCQVTHLAILQYILDLAIQCSYMA
jgi:hypothetical protein